MVVQFKKVTETKRLWDSIKTDVSLKNSKANMMNMPSRKQYFQTVKNRYFKTKSKKERSAVLDEYCANTKQNRKYVIRKLNKTGSELERQRRQRARSYDGQVSEALVRMWDIFDYPSGQRLESILKEQTDRLRRQKELRYSEAVAGKLKIVSARTIDDLLIHERRVKRLQRNRNPAAAPLLYRKIPIKLMSEQDRNQIGLTQLDFVTLCGQSAAGEFVHILSATDTAFGWWEGQGQMGRSQRETSQSLSRLKPRLPFKMAEIHCDNDSGFINDTLYRWTQDNNVNFSRSRPGKKNDNALVEQKNWTHVRKVFGYLRYDTQAELKIINDLCENELRLFKNFFLPVMKLIAKERVGGRVKRKYDKAKTPYQRVMASKMIDQAIKKELTKVYDKLNPAALKRTIDQKLNLLYKTYQAKQRSPAVNPAKKQRPRTVTKYIAQPTPISVT